MIKSNTDDFIVKSKKVHGDKYNYSLVIYKNDKTKVKIICSIHGEFEQRPNSHLKGCGCKNCGNESQKKTNIFDNFKITHGDKYNYSLVEYKNNRTKIKIICPIHGIFEQTPYHHTNNGCQQCATNVLPFNLFIDKCNDIHKNKYDYSLVEYSNKSKVRIICPTHGIFEQNHLHHSNGSGCPKCRVSRGEEDVKKWLDNKNIKYTVQHKFPNCKNKLPLPFDFYLTDYNICIEYDGRQHYTKVWGDFKSYEEQIKRDTIKNDYCQKNNITLLRIKYDENINNKLNTIMKNT